jgi:integrase
MALSLGFPVSVRNISRFNMLELISFRIYPATQYKRMVTEQQRQWKPEQRPFIPAPVNKCADSGHHCTDDKDEHTKDSSLVVKFLLFTSERGDGNQRLSTIDKFWREIRKDAGLPWLRLHDLRHNFALMLANSGRTLYEVQQILGHSDSKVTERYAHMSTETLQAAANSVTDYMDKALDKTGA